MKAAKTVKNFLPAVLILAMAFAVEAIFSNFVYFAYVAGKTQVKDFAAQEQAFEISEENLFADVTVDNFPLYSVSFTVKSADEAAQDSLASVNVYVFDENNTKYAGIAKSERIAVGQNERRVTVYVNSLGDASGISLNFADYNGKIIVSDIIINQSYEFGFDVIRFAAIYIFAAVIYILKFGTGKLLRDKMTFNHAALVSCALCCFAAAFIWILSASGEYGNYIAYPLEGGAEYYQPYLQQMDAFIKGQLHLDVQPSPELLALENPYSPDEREGIFYLFDRAFYEGKYYSYFGIAPILVVYYPFYLLTGFLPVESTVMGIFSLITALFLPLAVIEWARLRNRNMRPWLAAVCAVGTYFASMVLIIQRGNSPFYYIASVAGTAFVSAFIFWVLKAFGSKKKVARIACMALAGCAFALGFLSRINSVLPAAIIIAAVVIIYFVQTAKSRKYAAFFSEMAALALPVAAAIGFSFYYNYIRFGSVLQFGSDYQLTIANPSLYEISLGGILPALYHYFLQPLDVAGRFPYITLSYSALSDYGKTMYIDSSFGIFALPFMLSLLLSPVLFKNKEISKNGKALLAVSLVSFVATAFFDFCMGGVIFRYTSDISLLAAFVSAVILLELTLILQENHSAAVSKFAKKAVLILTAVTVCTAFFTSITINGNLVEYAPDIHIAMRDFFVFWS